MKNSILIGVFVAFSISASTAQEAIIIDHSCDNLAEIPAEWIDSAKSRLFIAYGHTSHGSQLISGMNALKSYYTDGTYNWSHEGGEDALHLFEGSQYSEGDLDHDAGYAGWDDKTRTYLDANPSCNVLVWSWCGQVDDVDLDSHYFTPMEELEAEYPNVKFVYMTGHLEGEGIEGNLNTANQTIRDYCLENRKVLFDFADIEKYDPDALINYQELWANDACLYDPDGSDPIERTVNWATQWLSNNPSHELSSISSLCGECSHSVSLNCIKKGIASWYLWARLAGWQEVDPGFPVTDIRISSEGDADTISMEGGTLQLYASVLPENASIREVSWSVTNSTGQADINSSGLLTAISNGLVIVRASAMDGTGIYDEFSVTIFNQSSIAIESISISSEGAITEITVPGGSLQLYAQILPASASDQNINWEIISNSGNASVNQAGLVTAIANGTVSVQASSLANESVNDAIEITISGQTADAFQTHQIIPDIRISGEDLLIRNEDFNIQVIRVVSLNGGVLLSEKVFSDSHSISLSGLKSGIYAIQAISDLHGYRSVLLAVP
ncbi:MAG: Ig-like domain-containing protein [Bacteroidales bacterium]|nr:Ig-like domain-containing protein [Bacteroidales bacterium]